VRTLPSSTCRQVQPVKLPLQAPPSEGPQGIITMGCWVLLVDCHGFNTFRHLPLSTHRPESKTLQVSVSLNRSRGVTKPARTSSSTNAATCFSSALSGELTHRADPSDYESSECLLRQLPIGKDANLLQTTGWLITVSSAPLVQLLAATTGPRPTPGACPLLPL
jgi:hypothetical protein